MGSKWVSYRIEQVGKHSERRQAVVDLADELDPGCWDETTSFFLIDTSLSAKAVAKKFAACLDLDHDRLIVGSTDKVGVYYAGDMKMPAVLESHCDTVERVE